MCHEYNLMQFDYHKELHYEFKYNFFKLPYRALTV